MKKQTIVVKIGTNALTKEDGNLNLPLLEDFVGQLALAHKQYNVLLVTSGAMGAGRSILQKELPYDDVTSRQLYAVVGQVRLMEIYSKMFSENGITIAQMLATRQDFENRTHYLNTKNCIESLFREDIVPILNENDFVCIEELMFTDNDELSGIISKLLFADKLIMLSNVDGVLDENAEVISEVQLGSDVPAHIEGSGKSSFGKGGMQTKFNIAQKTAGHGTEVYIANSRCENVVTRILSGEAIGTKFKTKND